MTTILAVQKKGKVTFGADSQVTAANGRVQKHTQMIKISQRGVFLIAGSGECSPCDIVQHIWKPPSPKGMEWDNLYHFLIGKVVPSLKACFKQQEYKWDREDEETKFHFLLALGGQVFELADDMSVSMDERGFYGVGSGSSYGIGALEAGASIEKALEIAAKNDAYTSAPFTYYTQTLENKIMKGKL